MYDEEESSWSFTIGVFVGAIAGAVLASLYTPRSGAQNRDAVRERGLVLKERVSDRTHTATSSVKGTASGYVSSIKDTTSSVSSSVRETAQSVRETASSATASVKQATHTAVERVGETVETVKERASATAASVSETASSTAARVSETASTTVGKLQESASSAAERARQLRQRDHGDEQDATLPAATTLAAEARYDAVDVRPATATDPSATTTTTEIPGATASTAPSTATGSTASSSSRTEPLQVLSSLDTFEPTMADVTAATPAQPIDERSADAAANDLASDEQFDTAETNDQSRARGEAGSSTGASKPDADRES